MGVSLRGERVSPAYAVVIGTHLVLVLWVVVDVMLLCLMRGFHLQIEFLSVHIDTTAVQWLHVVMIIAAATHIGPKGARVSTAQWIPTVACSTVVTALSVSIVVRPAEVERETVG